MEKIISKNNNHIVEAAKLKQTKHRKFCGKFLIEGDKVIQMAIDSDYIIDIIFIDESKRFAFAGVIEKAENMGIKLYLISNQASAKIASSKNPQGIFAVAEIKYSDIDNVEGDLIIACENLNDPGNMGTIIRTADAVGVKCLLLSSNCVDVYNEKVIRASMGSVFNVGIIIADDFIASLEGTKKIGYHAGCGHLNGDDFFGRKTHEKNILVIGNEANGITDEAASLCDSLWKLPMQGSAESLNAAVAAGIMMYDIMRKN